MLECNYINVHSDTRPHLALQKWEPAGRIGDFGNFFNGLAKGPVIIYVEGRGEGKKEGGVKLFQIGYVGGGELNVFYKDV